MSKEDISLACPCCGALTLDEHGGCEICDTCGWEDDTEQSDEPDYAGGANKESLNQARQRWSLTGRRK
jgi:Cysteine-rich CPCC